ncbi:MAG: hypothetical protein K2G31_05435, partial [Clostridia bacterium]|nr:hypothetical protein [Clostridia bacterium]
DDDGLDFCDLFADDSDDDDGFDDDSDDDEEDEEDVFDALRDYEFKFDDDDDGEDNDDNDKVSDDEDEELFDINKLYSGFMSTVISYESGSDDENFEDDEDDESYYELDKDELDEIIHKFNNVEEIADMHKMVRAPFVMPAKSSWVDESEFESAVKERKIRLIKSDMKLGLQGAIRKAETYLEAVRDTSDAKMIQVYERLVLDLKNTSAYQYAKLKKQYGGEV